MGGGMTAGSQSAMGRLQKARMMNKGGGADMSKKKKTKSGSSTTDIFKSYGKYDGKPIELSKGGLKAELNNPAKGYTAGGMADYYKDLM